MNDNVAMAGFLRVVYFFALAAALVILIMTGVTNIYEEPDDGPGGTSPMRMIPGGLPAAFLGGGAQEDDVEESNDRANYDRNIGAIFSLIGAAAMTFGILGLRQPANAVRTGIVAGGLAIFFAGTASGAKGADDWLVSIWALLAFVGLAVSGPYLNNGLDALTGWLDRTTKRWWPRPSA